MCSSVRPSKTSVAIAKHAQSTQNNKSVMSLQYHEKEGRNKVGFMHVDNIKPSCKLILSVLVGMVSHTQSTQNNFAKSFQYLKIGQVY